MKTSFTLLLGAAALAAFPCIGQAATAQENWDKNCKLCHGADGAGTTPQGVRLKLKNYTDPAVQAALTDEVMIKAIKEGVKNEAGKPVMPGYAAKLSDADITALVQLIRSFAKPAS